jgi:hypothetical protein
VTIVIVGWTEGELIRKLCEAMENHERPRDDHLRGTARAINHGLETWEPG